MTELTLMTVDITVTDRDSQGFGLGGPKEQARAMATAALVQRLNMAPPADGRLLNVSMTAAELRPIVEWIKEQFPQLGFCPLTEKPLPLAKGKSPWRFFNLGSAEGVPVDDDLTAAVCGSRRSAARASHRVGSRPRSPHRQCGARLQANVGDRGSAGRAHGLRRSAAARHEIARGGPIPLQHPTPSLRIKDDRHESVAAQLGGTPEPRQNQTRLLCRDRRRRHSRPAAPRGARQRSRYL